ncbi:MAG: phosphatidylglycerophosphatase A [Sulfuricaulis sp.]|uniref:phosphatidylglycerophosphatase A family protein n=1 Tax=Sulfuricaulis sp. TaxID=2003553 RepID=UPI0025CE0F2C|nr:phosphatidylglycerophosphatase A [Sulfuricaulis sp.]MCR4346457.1 phosphatidylglycerophosphatase A [Sulfuricaulis sp.]
MTALRKFARFLAFGFGAGNAPMAPGTFGTLVGIPIYLLLQPLSALTYAVVVFLLFGLGIWICHVTEKDLGVHDHPGIVWDEIVGYLITMFMAPNGWMWIVTGFILFRLFDIWKPFPIRQIERRIQGGLGNMLDDALAGFYSLAVIQAAVYWMNVQGA